jgi:purine-binding chemotaxis protein CheW
LKRENNPVGMIVDAVSEVLRFPRETVEPAPSMVSNIDSQSIAGVAKVEDRILILLDMEKLFSDTEQINL